MRASPLSTLREWTARILGVLRPHRRDAEIERELQSHLELAADDERWRTASPDEARRAALLRAGQVPQAMAAVRDQHGVPWLDNLALDVRHALRALRRTPLFTTVTLVTLAIAIGANTAVFSIVNSVLIKPLAYPDADELVGIWHTAPGAGGLTSVSGDLRLSPSMYFTYAEQNRTFQALGVWAPYSATVTDLAEPEQVEALAISDGTLQALAVPPLLGRWLSAADQQPDAPRVVILGYGYWQQRFGGDPAVVGRDIRVDGRTREIVGVMPDGFRIGEAGFALLAPIAFDRSRVILPGFGFQAVGRLRPGATIAEASTDIARLVPIWMTSWPAAPTINPRIYETWRITPALRPLKADVVGGAGQVLWVLMGTLGIVLLIACANVANLLLVRTEGRQPELALRASLGAGRERIVRGLLLESLLLAGAGGLVGLGLAYGALRALVAVGPVSLPRLGEIAIDPRAVVFTLAVSLLAGLLFGLLPALKYSGVRLSAGLRGGTRTASDGRERHRARSVLVVTQVALAIVLLVSSGLMLRTLQTMRTVDPGFTGAPQVQTVRTSIPVTLVTDPARVARMQQDLVDALATIPGVSAVGFSSVMHMEGLGTPWDAVRAEGAAFAADEVPPMRVFKFVSPGFLQTTGTRLIAGRDYTWTDITDRRLGVIVSENLARELWGSATAALGKRLQTVVASAPWREVIGVVQDVRDNGVHEPAPAIVYWPAFGEGLYRAGAPQVTRAFTIALRTDRAGTEALLREMQQRLWAIDANLPLASVRTLQDLYDQSMARSTFASTMLAVAAAAALLLGIVGIYGVIAYAVSQRTREIGIRLALGARPAEIERMFVRYGLVLTGIGVVIGLGAAAAATRLMTSLLVGVDRFDPATYVAVPVVLATAALVAAYLPARRVLSVDPVDALKAE